VFRNAASPSTAAGVIDILTDPDLDDELAVARIARFELI